MIIVCLIVDEGFIQYFSKGSVEMKRHALHEGEVNRFKYSILVTLDLIGSLYLIEGCPVDERALGPGVGLSCATSLSSDDIGLYKSRLFDEQARDWAVECLRNGAHTVYSAERQVINEVG